MKFSKYQEQATTTAQYPGQGEFMGLAYAALGVGGEAGEVCEQVKKAWRNDGEMTPERREKTLAEVGDVLWYLAQVCTELDASLSDVANANLRKLADRRARNAIKSEGDAR